MSDLKPEGTTSGAPKRRRRRRSRRPSGQNQNSQNSQNNQSSPNTPSSQNSSGEQGSTAQKNQKNPKAQKSPAQNSQSSQSNQSAAGEKSSSRPKRRRSRRGRKGEGQKQTQTPTQEKAKNKGRRSPTRRRSNTRVQQSGQQSRMVTSDETSAGGLVVSGLAESVNDLGEVDLSKIYVALIGRLDRRGRLLWSMPKGHVEPGEAKAATAEREVWEETGIHGEVFTDLGVIDYWFVSEGKRIHKTVHHHLLRYVDGDLNDEDPEVTEVAWIPAHQLIEHLAFADERKLARKAHDLLPEFALKEKAEGRATPR